MTDKPVAERATELRRAIEDSAADDDCGEIKKVRAGGGVHINMAMKESLVRPIHRAARLAGTCGVCHHRPAVGRG